MTSKGSLRKRDEMLSRGVISLPSAAVRPWNGLLAICLRALLALICFTSTAQAQYRFDSWTADTGLPQNVIRGLFIDHDGNTWALSGEKLMRWTGREFGGELRERRLLLDERGGAAPPN